MGPERIGLRGGHGGGGGEKNSKSSEGLGVTLPGSACLPQMPLKPAKRGRISAPMGEKHLGEKRSLPTRD